MATKPYKEVSATHEAYAGPRLALLDALDHGGYALLGNDKLLQLTLRRNLAESDDVWKERSARAVYPNYLGAVISLFVSTVFGDSLTVKVQDDGGPDDVPEEWQEWLKDCAIKGARPFTFEEHMRKVLRRLLVSGKAYTMVELPTKPPVPLVTLAQEDAAGQRRPYLLEIDPCAVIDWDDDETTGEMCWCVIKSVSTRRRSIGDSRDMVTETFRELDGAGWKLWQITYDKRKQERGPGPDDPVALVAAGSTSFGRIQIIRHDIDAGMHAADLMCSSQCDIFRARSGMAWLRDRVNVPAPYLKLQNVKPDGTAPDDLVASKGRGKVQNGIGGITYLAQDDELGFAAPDPGALTINLAMYENGVEEVRSVVHQMQAGSKPTAASQQQSGESKAKDASSMATVSKSLGADVRSEAREILVLAALGRAEDVEWALSGCDEIELDTAQQALTDLVALEGATLPPTLRKELVMRATRMLLPGQDDKIDLIDAECDDLFPPEAAAQDAEARARAAVADHTAENPAPPEPKGKKKAA